MKDYTEYGEYASLIEWFETLSEEDKQKVRDGMDKKMKEIGQSHLNEIGVYLTN